MGVQVDRAAGLTGQPLRLPYHVGAALGETKPDSAPGEQPRQIIGRGDFLKTDRGPVGPDPGFG